MIELAPDGTTHLFLHANSPAVSLHKHDQELVVSAYDAPSVDLNYDDSSYADAGYEKLCEDPAFDGSPMYFERVAAYCESQFRRLQKEVDDSRLEEVIDIAYNLACGVEHMKLNTQNFWKRCEAEMNAMGEAMDGTIDAFEERYDTDLQYLENVLLGARSRVHRSLRVSVAWGSDHNWSNAAGIDELQQVGSFHASSEPHPSKHAPNDNISGATQ